MTTKPSPDRPGTSITEALRTDVLSAKLAPGSRLVELQLAEQCGASRASVRAAIAELEKEGLVDREANRGATVRRVTIEEAVQITEARRLLEGLVAGRAAATATESDRAELLAISRQMHAAVAGERSASTRRSTGCCIDPSARSAVTRWRWS